MVHSPTPPPAEYGDGSRFTLVLGVLMVLVLLAAVLGGFFWFQQARAQAAERSAQVQAITALFTDTAGDVDIERRIDLYRDSLQQLQDAIRATSGMLSRSDRQRLHETQAKIQARLSMALAQQKAEKEAAAQEGR